MDIPVSILDLALIGSGATASEALQNSVELARRGEELGVKRHWFAEHHSMPSIATSSPEILMEHVAAATDEIRVGSGGIMLPNHVPLKVAESFHTLEALHPDRIDLGIGRAPGTDQTTARALRSFDASKFGSQFEELRSLSGGDLPGEHPFSSVRVMPDDVELPPIWILGSSGASAKFSGRQGVGYGFASHFSDTDPRPALDAYRDNFEPTEEFPEPHVIMAVGVVCAESEERADYLAKSLELAAARRRRGDYSPFPTPEEAEEFEYSSMDRAAAKNHRKLHFIGTPEKVRGDLEAFVEKTGADELMVASFIHGHENRVKSMELLVDELDDAENEK